VTTAAYRLQTSCSMTPESVRTEAVETAAAGPPPVPEAAQDGETRRAARKTIAVVGASGDRRKYGNKCVRAYLDAGWEVYPVNLTEAEIEGRTAYQRVGEVPAELDRIAMYLPPPRTRELLPELAAKSARDGVFFNPGTWDREVIAEAEELGIRARRECAIVALGTSPARYPA